MTNCAVIDEATGDILNIIVASPTDQAFPGTRLVAIPGGSSVGLAWRYTDTFGFVSPRGQRFYTWDSAGAASPISTAAARAICTQDVVDEKTGRLTLSAAAVYQAAVSANAVELTADIATYTFNQCVAFTTFGWPSP